MILGIDPGIRKIGYAITKDDLTIVDAGVLLLDKKAPTRTDQFERMKQIYDFFVGVCTEHPIRVVGIEKLFFTQYNQSNAEFVYGIRGALAMYFNSQELLIYEWTPKEIKKRITGNGLASKELMQKSVQKLFRLSELPDPHDAADALALCRMIQNSKQQLPR